jgi:hypothetical protein
VHGLVAFGGVNGVVEVWDPVGNMRKGAGGGGWGECDAVCDGESCDESTHLSSRCSAIVVVRAVCVRRLATPQCARSPTLTMR